MKKDFNLTTVSLGNVDRTGFFCYMSKRHTPGYASKLDWLKGRFDEGLKLVFTKQAGRGFIEYIPGRFAWRPVEAEGYMFIHCLWVVGQSRGRGLATALLDLCFKDAQKAGLKGVAMVTSQDHWLVEKEFLAKQGFVSAGSLPPSFELMVKNIAPAPPPVFVNGLADRPAKYPSGLTVFTTGQCPYLESALQAVQAAGRRLGISCLAKTLKSSGEVRRQAPSAYGTYSVIYKGRLLTYRSLPRDEIVKLIERQDSVER